MTDIDISPEAVEPPCTCHPDDQPPKPCPQKYALTDCRIAALSAALTQSRAETAAATRAKDCFQRMTRAHWEALCAMRNSINEYIPMPNTDSGPLFSPEDGPIYADIAKRVVVEISGGREYALALERELKDRSLATPALSAALTQSRAETAAAYERAAETLAIRQQDYRPDTTTWLQIQMDIHSIRALATPDQSSALAAIEAAAEARGMRKAAECCQAVANEAKSYHIPQMTLGAMSCRDDILAAIPQGDTTNE